MKPNSCLYRAVKRVVEYQFNVTSLSSNVFDRYNTGEGVPTEIIVNVINEALSKYGICVSAVYGNIFDRDTIEWASLIKPPKFVSAPCIGHVDNHVEAILPGEFFNGDMAITLERTS